MTPFLIIAILIIITIVVISIVVPKVLLRKLSNNQITYSRYYKLKDTFDYWSGISVIVAVGILITGIGFQ